jgi:hypothetical protein
MARDGEIRDKVLARLRERLDRMERLLAAATAPASSQDDAPRVEAIKLPSLLDAHHPLPRTRRPRQRHRASA